MTMLHKIINNYRNDSLQKILAWCVFLPSIFLCIYLYLFGFTLLQCLFIYLILHFISVIPLQVYLNKKNRWEKHKPSGPYQIWLITHPTLFKLGSLGIVYPYIFVFLLLVLRYNRLGEPISIEISFSFLILVVLFLIIIICNFSTFLLLWNLFSGLKEYFWEKSCLFFRFIYYFILQNNLILIIFLKLKAYYFYIVWIINLKSDIYWAYTPKISKLAPGEKYVPRKIVNDWEFDPKKDFGFIRKFLFFVHMNPIFFPIVLFVFLILEIICTFQIYYFFYILYYYFIMYLVWKGFKYLGSNVVISDACMSDYIYRNFENLRYPHVFLRHINYPVTFASFELKLSKKESEILEKSLENLKPFFRKNVFESTHNKQLFDRINKKDTPMYKRLAASFHQYSSTKRKPKIKSYF